MDINSCSLFGGSTYVNQWMGIIFAVLIISILIVVIIYILSKLLTSSLNGKLTAVAKSELMQVFISVIILLVLTSFLSTACNMTTSLSQSLINTKLTPFEFANYYIGNLAFARGIGIITNLYTYSMTYAIDARIWTALSSTISKESGDLSPTPGLTVSTTVGADLGSMYSVISDAYIIIIAPFLVISIGTLILQWLAIPLFEYTAFSVVLPVALVMRIFSTSGGGLRRASNDILALAIALYLIYPMMISFDAYAINYIFSTNNPVYSCTNCLNTPFVANTAIASGFFTKSTSYSTTSSVNGATFTSPSIDTLLDTTILSSEVTSMLPPEVMLQFDYLIEEVSQYMFTALFMFGIDLIVTVAFAMGLSKALNSGIDGAASFWSSV
jgi:hypothetical protein